MRQLKFEKELRIVVAGSCVAVLIALLLTSLAYHQVFRYRFFWEQSENNRIRIQPIVPKRGMIFDRNREIIVDNRLSFTVSVVPNEKVDSLTFLRLSQLLTTDSASVAKRYEANFIGKFVPTPIMRGLDMDVISILEENGRKYPGVAYSAESVRRYSDSLAAETFIGYIGEVSVEEKKGEAFKDYRPGSIIGKKGVERNYDRQLRGIEGTRFIEVSARGQVVGNYADKESIPAIPGSDLVLTIDKDLQNFAVANFNADTTRNYNGSVVAIDPRNGEILALVSVPGYDPNIFAGVISPDEWTQISNDPAHPLLNRPISGLFPPGSTSKLLTAGAALELGLITPETLFKPCLGGMRFGNRFFRCWEPRGHGRTNVYGGIEQSCDVYFYQLGQILGVDNWSKYAFKCGFGSKSGIDIPGELPGIVPSTKYYDRVFGKGKWSRLLILNLAIGQGEFTITPIQLAQFYCGLANHGQVYRPHLLKEIIKPDGSIEAVKPEISFELPFSQNTLQVLNEALKLVVQGGSGTARGQRSRLYNISGKTGTAQNPHGNDHSWFVAFAPTENPEIVVAALVENAGHGSEKAAPLVGKIIKYYLTEKSPTFAFLRDTSSTKP